MTELNRFRQKIAAEWNAEMFVRAAQKPAAEPAPLAVGQTVDPRVLPVGAVFRYKWATESAVHRVEAGEASVRVETGQRLPLGSDPAIIISLPEPSSAEPCWERAEQHSEDWSRRIERYRLSERWRIVFDGVTSAAMATRGEARERIRVLKANVQPEPTAPRWPNTPAEHHARLDALLAAQVASGGQDCAPARSLIERADRLRREADLLERGRLTERYHGHAAIASHGLAPLKLERPLISYKRGR
jgi:hypothetical protein